MSDFDKTLVIYVYTYIYITNLFIQNMNISNIDTTYPIANHLYIVLNESLIKKKKKK